MNRDIPVGATVKLSPSSRWLKLSQNDPFNPEGKTGVFKGLSHDQYWATVDWGNGKIMHYIGTDSDLIVTGGD